MKSVSFKNFRLGGSLPAADEITVPTEAEGYLNDFLSSASSMLEELEGVALAWDRGQDREANLSSAKRILHSIKGEAGILGLEQIYELCHEAESVIVDADDPVELLLRAKDWLAGVLLHLSGQVVANGCEETAWVEEISQRKRILIVEDDFVSRMVLQQFLSDVGDCFVAVNGVEAIEAVIESLESGQRYDLICLDIGMPEMDGLECLAQIREQEKNQGILGLDGTKVIMTTCKDSSEDIMGAFRAGCEAYVVKPVERPVLLKEMRKLRVIE